MFDLVILVGKNDIEKIKEQIHCTKKNIIGYRNIYIITPFVDKITGVQFDNCNIIDEITFPLKISHISNIHGKSFRNTWYLQQLIKLYVSFFIPEILDKYLVIDSDTFFLKPTTFEENEDITYFNYGSVYHNSYFEHMKKLHPSLYRMNMNISGVVHHMMFEKQYIQQLFTLVEDLHKKPFWLVFLQSVNSSDISKSGASEYEIYLNFMMKYNPTKIKLRKLLWKDSTKIINGYDYVSLHWYQNEIKMNLSSR